MQGWLSSRLQRQLAEANQELESVREENRKLKGENKENVKYEVIRVMSMSRCSQVRDAQHS